LEGWGKIHHEVWWLNSKKVQDWIPKRKAKSILPLALIRGGWKTRHF
jgi:hypothetical protein